MTFCVGIGGGGRVGACRGFGRAHVSAPLEFTRGKSMEEENGLGIAVAYTMTGALWRFVAVVTGALLTISSSKMTG